MHASSQITIQAPPQEVFEFTSDLSKWPERLPHYRFIQELGDGTVKMACFRGAIPISWVSKHEVDPEKREQRFTHLKAWTKGMEVVWTYDERPDGGTDVTIIHDLKFRIPALAPVIEPVIGHGFIDPVAGKTLATFKRLLENR